MRTDRKIYDPSASQNQTLGTDKMLCKVDYDIDIRKLFGVTFLADCSMCLLDR